MQAHGALHAGTQQLGLPDPKSLRILVVDSKAVSRQNTTQLLRECSYQVTAVKTARECLQLLIEAEHGAGFDLVLKEHEPPGANACRLLKRMAKTEGLTRTPVVVTSTQDERDTVMTCLSMGAIDYLIKPLRQNELRHIWTRVWWWRKSQGQHVATYPSAAAHAPRHYAFRGPGSANRQYEATSSDSKQTKCQEEEEPTSKEGSAPDNGNGNGSKGNGSNGSKEGNGTSRVDAQGLHCDIKDTGHGSNGNGHGSNNGNGHGSNGNGSNGSSDNKNGGNGNSATKGDGNGNGSNGNGASTTLAVDRHYQALVNTAEGKMPPNLGASHDGLTGVIKSGTMGRSSAFAQYTGPSTSSRKRAATSEAAPPGTRDRDPRANPMDEDTGAGGSTLPTVEGIATGGGGGTSGGVGGGPGGSGSGGGGLGRSKMAAQRERAAAALRAAGGGHAASEDTFQQHTNPNRSGGGGAGGSGSGGPGSNGGGGGLGNNGSSSHHHPHTKQLAVSSERPGSQGISPSHYASMHTHTPSGGAGGISGGSRAAVVQQQQHSQPQKPQLPNHGSTAWASGLLPHPHAALAGLAPAVVPPGLSAGFAGMFTAPFGLAPGHMLSRMAHSALRFGPGGAAPTAGGGPGAPSSEPVPLQSLFPFSPPEVLAAAAAVVAAASVATTEVHSHAAVRGGPHGVHATHGPPGSLLLGPLTNAEGPGAGTVAPTSGATNLNAMILNQLLASGVPLAFLGQPNPLSALNNAQGPGHPPQPATRGPPHPPPGPGLAPHHHHNPQQAAAAAVAAAAAAAAAAVWRPPPFTHPATIAAAAAAAAGAVLPFPGPMPPGVHSGAPLGGDLQAGAPCGPCGAGLQHRDASQAAAVAAALLAAAHDGGCTSAGRSGRPSLVSLAEPKRRRALALDKYRKKRKNLRFSKTIRYEARKQLAQQRPRVRGQFTKHCGAGGGGGDDGAATMSNGAKSGTGGAGGVACDDGGGEEEVHTSSRGYYEEEDYDVGEAEEDETEAELDEMELEGSRDRAGQLHPRSRTGQRQTQPVQQGELEDMDLDADTLGGSGGAAATAGTAPASASGGGAGAGSKHGVQPTSNSPVPSGAAGVAKRSAAGAGGGMGGSLRGMGGGGSGGGRGAMDEGDDEVEMEEDPAAAVVRSLLGLRDAAHAARVSRPQADTAGMSGPAVLQEMKSSRSVGSQGSLSREWGRDRDRDRDRDRSGRERERDRERDRGHSRGHSHSHGHSHSQQQQHSQGHSHGVQGLGGLPHGVPARTHSLLRQGSFAAETLAGVINQPTAAPQPPRAPSPTGGISPGGPSPQQTPQGGAPMHMSGGPGISRALSSEPLLTSNCNPALQQQQQQHQQHAPQNPPPPYQQHHSMHQTHKLQSQVPGLHGHGSVSPSQPLSYMGGPSASVPQSGQGQAGCGCPGPAGSAPRCATHSSAPMLQQPQQAVSQQQLLQTQAASHGAGATGAAGGAVSGRGTVTHGMGCDPRDAREHREREGRDREREHRDAGRDREARDREAGAMLGDTGTGNGKNGSDSGSNSPDENGAGGGTGRAKSAAEKVSHGSHKAASGHGHGHR